MHRLSGISVILFSKSLPKSKQKKPQRIASWIGAANSQGFRLSRIKAFFRWAHALHKIDENPAVMFRSIKREQEGETQPLTAKQFDELLAATYKYDADRRANKDRFGADLRAIFLTMRWTGLRLSDVLLLPGPKTPAKRACSRPESGLSKIENLPFCP